MTIAQTPLIDLFSPLEVSGTQHGPFDVADWPSIRITFNDQGPTFSGVVIITWVNTPIQPLNQGLVDDFSFGTLVTEFLPVRGRYFYYQVFTTTGAAINYTLQVWPGNFNIGTIETAAPVAIDVFTLTNASPTSFPTLGTYDVSQYSGIIIKWESLANWGAFGAIQANILPVWFNDPAMVASGFQVTSLGAPSGVYYRVQSNTLKLTINSGALGAATARVTIYGTNQASRFDGPYSINQCGQLLVFNENVFAGAGSFTIDMPFYTGPAIFTSKANNTITCVTDLIIFGNNPPFATIDMFRGPSTPITNLFNIWIPPFPCRARPSAGAAVTLDTTVVAA
jgi:hypothetical protein